MLMNIFFAILSTFLIFLQVCFTSCVSIPVLSSSEDVLIKNWDTVNMLLESYCGNSLDGVLTDFGEDYVAGENLFIFHSPTEESSITFFVKKEKVKGYAYDGSYPDLLKFLAKSPRFNNSEIKAAANAWLGFSSDLLLETFGSLILKSNDKLIVAGPSESVCIEFTIATYSPMENSSTTSDSSENSPTNISTSSTKTQRYIKKVKIQGTYEELKDYLVKVPDESMPVKKIKQKNL